MNSPLVSICCITYNHSKYIQKCLDGFMMQETNFEYEVLIHDDASTDGTSEIIKEYVKRFPDIIKPIYQTENQYSKGVKISPTYLWPKAAKYIAICEGDDYWIDPLKLQKQVDFLEANPDYSLCFHNAHVFSEETNQYTLFQTLRTGEYTGEEILTEWTIPTASVMFRSAGYSPVSFTNPDFCYGDIILFLSLAESGKLWCNNEVCCVYRRHTGGISFGNKKISQTRTFIKHHMAISQSFSRKYKNVERKIIAKLLMFLSFQELKLYSLHSIYTFFKSVFMNPAGSFANFKSVYLNSFKRKRARKKNEDHFLFN